MKVFAAKVFSDVKFQLPKVKLRCKQGIRIIIGEIRDSSSEKVKLPTAVFFKPADIFLPELL